MGIESGRSTRLHGLMVRKFTCTNTFALAGRKLTTRTATAWTIGARIFVELEEPTEISADLSDYATNEEFWWLAVRLTENPDPHCGKFMRRKRSGNRGSERKVSIRRSARRKYGRSGDRS